MNPFKIFFQTFSTTKEHTQKSLKSFYDLEMNALNGKPIFFKEFKGKYVLIVNVASKCGFTPQYKDLQKLQDLYKEHLIIVGIPCNQFGGQEPGDAETINTFCEINYGVTFQMTEKVMVKGSLQHPVYEWLTNKSLNGKKDSEVRWNFQKYLISPQGEWIDFFYSTTNPLSKKITKHFM